VIADTSTLQTLAPREYRAGMAEVVKYGFIRDAAFVQWIEGNADRLAAREEDAVMHAVRRSCELKAEVVAQDEREHGLRALLNFGHTFGHAIETAAGYGALLHGEAVAAGMVMAMAMSVRLGWLPPTERDRAVRLLEKLGLPVAPPRIGAQRGRELMGMDKKVLGGRIRLVLLRELGRAVVADDYAEQALDATLQEHFG
jgi:3-dehydroquinate synthase